MKEVTEVMATEQPCDVAYEFGSGDFDFQEYPQGFPKPGYLIFVATCGIFVNFVCVIHGLFSECYCRKTSMAV